MIKVTTGHANADIEGTRRYSSNTFAIWALEGGGRSTPIHGKDPVPILRATGWVWVGSTPNEFTFYTRTA
jgi:hypothetical protein